MEHSPESDIAQRVTKTLESVRPYLQQDGGDVEFDKFIPETGVLFVRLVGACRDCPMSMMTLRAGIERILRKEIPEIRRVEKAR